MMKKDLRDKVFAFTSENGLFSDGCHVLLGLSGGADSMTLLHMLTHWETPLLVSVIHVHHGIRGDAADRDEAFVREYCARNGISLKVVHIDALALAKEKHVSLEDAGRQARYELFETTRSEIGADYVLTAHTADDRIETVLMNLIRGCGVDGLVGIPVTRDRVRRPLLCCTRTEIEDYCAAHNVPFITDETNFDTTYTRNDVRHRVLPLLRELNPAVGTALLRLSSHAAEDADCLNRQAIKTLSEIRCENGYSAAKMALAPLALRRRMIRLLLREAALPTIEEAHILAADEAVLHTYGTVSLPNGYVFSVKQGVVSVRMDIHEPPPEPVALDAAACSVLFGRYECVLKSDCPDDENVHKLFLQFAVDCDKIVGKLCIRHRQTGDYLHPCGRGVGKSLKKLMNEWHIPTHIRDAYPLLCDENGVILVPGYACDERVRVTDATKHYLVCEIQKVQG